MIGNLVTEFLTVFDFLTLGGVLPITFFLQDLRGRNQCDPPLHTCEKTLTASNPAQLLEEIIAGHSNAVNDKKWWKMVHFHRKKWLKNHLWWVFLACMNSIFHARQFFINSEHIMDLLRAKKFDPFFTLFQPLFHRPADFRTLQWPPESDSWGFHGGIPSSGTQGSPPNHFWKKNISGLKSLTPSPSPLCTVQHNLLIRLFKMWGATQSYFKSVRFWGI